MIKKKFKLKVVTSNDALHTPLRAENDADCCFKRSKQKALQSLMTNSTVVLAERDQKEELAKSCHIQ